MGIRVADILSGGGCTVNGVCMWMYPYVLVDKFLVVGVLVLVAVGVLMVAYSWRWVRI